MKWTFLTKNNSEIITAARNVIYALFFVYLMFYGVRSLIIIIIIIIIKLLLWDCNE
jgi:hypothetical protein